MAEMKTVLQAQTGTQKRLEVSLDAAQWRQCQEQALRELARDFKRKGFRAGQAPPAQVSKLIGADTLLAKAAELAIQATLPQALRQHQQTPLTPPRIKLMRRSENEPLVYQAEFEAQPTVKLENYTQLALGKKKVAVTSDEVQVTLKQLQRSRAKLITVNRSARQGDRVEIDFILKSGGVKIEGGETRNHPFVIGEKMILPEMEKAVIGMTANQTRKISLVLPQNFPLTSAAGKNVTAIITLKLVQAVELPELNDEFAQNIGAFDNVADLKKSVREGILLEKKRAERERIDRLIMDKLIERARFELPQSILNQETERLFKLFQDKIKAHGLDFNVYLEKIKSNEQEIKKGLRQTAERQLRTEFILAHIAQTERVTVTEEEVAEATQAYLKRFRTPQEAHAHIDPKRLQEYTKQYLRDQKVMTFLRKENVL